jgi:subtilase family serine protease
MFYITICALFLILFVLAEGRDKLSKYSHESSFFKLRNELHSEHSLKNRFVRSQISAETSHNKKRSHQVVNKNGIHIERCVGLFRSDIIRESKALSEDIHEVIFAVQPRNQEKLVRILNAVSDPRNRMYGHHKTRKEVADLTSNPEGTAEVLSYLKAAGANVISKSLYGEYITASAPIQLWENLFDTRFHVYVQSRKNGEKKRVVRAKKYSLPAELIGHVVAVFNTVQLPMRQRRPLMALVERKGSLHAPVIRGVTIPSILNKAYKIDSNVASINATQGLYESLDQSFSPADLKKFQSRNSFPNQPVVRVIGGHSSDEVCINNPDNCVEANLDVQYMMAMSQSPTTYWYSDDNNFSDWLISVSNDPSPPLVLSISYGAPEYEIQFSELDAFNFEAQKLGLQGVTITVASGDDGVAGSEARSGKKYCGYTPDFPSSSPYVTSVVREKIFPILFYFILYIISNNKHPCKNVCRVPLKG